MEEYPSITDQDTLREERVSSDSTDAFGRYLRAIGEVELLTPEEEMDLAKRYAAGRAAQRMLDEEVEVPGYVREVADDGRAARLRMIEANLRLAVNIGKKYAPAYNGDKISAIQEGNIGLERAVDKYDYRKGYRFSTYATWWIKQNIQRAQQFADTETIRLPVYVHEDAIKIRTYTREAEQRTGNTPSLADIAEKTGVDPAMIVRIERARKLQRLDEPLSREDASSGSRQDKLEDAEQLTPEEEAIQSDVIRWVHKVISEAGLTEKERLVLECRFGFDGGESQTLEEVGMRLQLTRERIRQIQKRAQAKLEELFLEYGIDSPGALFS